MGCITSSPIDNKRRSAPTPSSVHVYPRDTNSLSLHAYPGNRIPAYAYVHAPTVEFHSNHNGYSHSAPVSTSTRNLGFSNNLKIIVDNYTTLDQITTALRNVGLESSNLIIGIDFTKSNLWTGKNSFGDKSLHYYDDRTPSIINPYMEVINIVGKTLAPFDDDNLIPVFGFGDMTTTDKFVFPLVKKTYINGLENVINEYKKFATNQKLILCGPTSFNPLIRRAIEITQETGQYHILVIITDGAVCDQEVTAKAIVDASNYPLSIVCIGVGDGPWDIMNEFDDGLPERVFDNFQFVEFNKIKSTAQNLNQSFESLFAVSALQEIPEQYQEIKKLRYLNKQTKHNTESKYVTFLHDSFYSNPISSVRHGDDDITNPK